MSSEVSTSSGKAKKIAAAAAAVALAAVLMIGGTISYLSDSTSTLTNTFDTPTIDVDIDETTDGYTIIPGTSESKDPTVTITTGVNAYVYLVVEDNTDGLVEYEIDTSVWTLLYTYDEDDCLCYDDDEECSDTCGCGFCTDGTIYVYYTTVDALDSEYKLNVLVDNTVSYSSAITNEDIEAYEDGDLTLSFTAYAIQMEPFCEDSEDNDAVKAGAEKAFLFAYYNINPDENVTGDVALVCTESKLKAALKDDDVEYILFVDDIGVTLVDSGKSNTMAYSVTVTKDTTLDLQGYTLSFDLESVEGYDYYITQGQLIGVPVLIGVTGGSLTIVADDNGAVDASAGLNSAYAVVVYDSDSSDDSDASVTINGGTYTGASHVVYVVQGSATINDGYFQFNETWETYLTPYLSDYAYFDYMLNCYDSNYKDGTASIVVYGGSYVNFNPSDCDAEGSGTSFVADGYTVTTSTDENGDTVYTVVDESSVEDDSSAEEESEEESTSEE